MNEPVGISWWDIANNTDVPCIKCGATVATTTTLGGTMETEQVIKRCRRCRHNQDIS